MPRSESPPSALRVEYRSDPVDAARRRALGLVQSGEVFPWLLAPGAVPVLITCDYAVELQRQGVPVTFAREES